MSSYVDVEEERRAKEESCLRLKLSAVVLIIIGGSAAGWGYSSMPPKI